MKEEVEMETIEDVVPEQLGNAAKMREALSDACYAMLNFLKTQNGGFDEMANAFDKAKSALAAPPRNCDVGTVEEQSERYHALCDSNKCTSCPCKFTVRTYCALIWAHMPYEAIANLNRSPNDGHKCGECAELCGNGKTTWCTHVRELVGKSDEACELFEPKRERSDKNENS